MRPRWPKRRALRLALAALLRRQSMRWWSANLVPPRSKTWHQHRSGNIAVSSNGYVCPDCSAADSVLFLFSSKSFRAEGEPNPTQHGKRR
jgi:hypothetical protein